MHARVATFELGDAPSVDEMINAMRRDMESGDTPPGLEDAKGVTVLIDRDKGKMLGVVFFDSEEALKRGDEALNKMSPPDEGGSRRSAVDFYEVPIQQTR
jgi:hypothetical protein